MDLSILQQTLQIAERYIAADETDPVVPHRQPAEWLAEFDLPINQNGMPEEAFMQLLENVTMATNKTASTAFFNQLYGGRNMVAVAAEIISVITNVSLYTYKVGGLQILIEKEVIAQMLKKVGFENGEGAFAPGGSLTNLVAMAVARNEKSQNIKNMGHDGRKYIVYSAEGHYSITKNAGLLGIGRSNVKKINSDSMGRMDPEKLRKQIQTDLQQGLKPLIVVSTAGTTVMGAFDQFEEIDRITKEFDLWHHVDGALGGSALLSERYKHLMKGCHLADSVSWNAHKLMGVPLTASVVMFKEKGMMKKHIAERAEYLFQSDDEDLNPGIGSIQCGRHNDALKVWAMWKWLGHEGYEKRINHIFDLTKYAAEKVKSDQTMRLILEPQCVTLCFQVLEKSSIDICNYLNQHGLAKVGYGESKGETFIRAAFPNHNLTEQDVDRFLEMVKLAAEKI